MSDSSPSLPPWEGPAILLVDLDAFFASVEQLDHPAWRGKPVIVGGDADFHGVVSTCSYEARAFGVRSAMASSIARTLCPDAIWTHGHFHRYREVSTAIMAILHDETPHVQQVSIDEAFMDVTPTAVNIEHPVAVAQRIQERVAALGVTCSIGVGTSKSVAKIASDRDKPHGLTVVFPGTEEAFLEELPVRTLSGVGAAAEKTLHAHGIRTLGQMGRADRALLGKVFGKNGEMMRDRALGRDRSIVAEDDEVKSVSNEMTYARDLDNRTDIEAALSTISAKVGRRLRRKGLKGRTVAVKVRYDNRTTRSAQCQLPAPTNDDIAFTPVVHRLIGELWAPGMRVRLLGVAISHFDDPAAPVQESLFDLAAMDETERADGGSSSGGTFSRNGSPTSNGISSPNANPSSGGTSRAQGARPAASAPLIRDEEKRRNLLAATDALQERFGDGTVRFGFELRQSDNTTGSSSKNVEDYK
ncbi:DNA polymerase IV [Adlercreutzia sp. R25]|uniref:DNA polymerase IV n=1 Tax=Adlercreutzia shanghongiae TaxID=3111773 RepID=UPI002DBF1A29|nr:DNA polymerase IV [Adlercreutzia sp. R25]MEC4272459.1 DNA polymerase IV [Adlercreutzia sp. R25]